ncbi:hypothetical protein G6F70_004859 [Rhizopus microsporus]|uniref:Enkurin domain-containing protein n=1 Tax=Rhizopus microsporus TaxID=58291 RepID=A0A1X0S624_RHIZD|nr:hypothetical protein G6F71_004884 [Rhizopus microsporus]KAG1199517.1 hypothetical protein G6F70_004859 [Rhizopus microsporus]KAG1211314.1 hypothetical protein G6F69_004706 [Rhizopus microsporus]KAG1234264.1 hypothetical protein G6F67_003664 [Rhizopus microsporus]KAG1265236.1 hypothetical protein G6F68_003746 [Rhizopus microsporus]
MSKNNKEKSSFWRKLGLGKNKSSNTSLSSEAACHDDKQDAVSIKSHRHPSMPRTSSFHKRQHSSPLFTEDLPPIPHGDIPKQSNNEQHVDQSEPYVMLSKSHLDDSPTIQQDEQKDSQALLQQEVSKLKEELEKERSVVDSLRKQKEAITKDLDYLGLTVDELYAEKSDLLQQLEEEKIKNQRQLEDMNEIMNKMKANADNARDQSFAVDQYKSELENHLIECKQEKRQLQQSIELGDKRIRELTIELNASREQVESLKLTMDQLIQSHAAEISRVTASAAAAAAAAASANNKKAQSYHMNTPNGSPQLPPKEEDDLCCSPIPSNLPAPSTTTTTPFGTPQSMDSDYRIKNEPLDASEEKDLDSQLMKLTKEKEKLQSFYSKIPLSGGGPQSRRRKEELEAMLDQVDSQLSKVKQRIRRS